MIPSGTTAIAELFAILHEGRNLSTLLPDRYDRPRIQGG